MKFDTSKSFVMGETALPLEGRTVPQERKSPPFSAFVEDRNRYLLAAPDAHFRPEQVQPEWDKLWTRIWLCAGRVSDVAKTSDWFRFDVGRESFIIVRSDDATISAFYNVCQHRANRLIDDDFGRASAFVCPYHSWRYDRAGRCTHVTDREFFEPAALAGDLNIPRVRCETWGGFVYINMDDNAPPLLDFLGEAVEVVAGYEPEKFEVRSDVILELACNWKTILDAFSEGYHVHITHPAAQNISEDRYAQMDFYPNGHTRRIVPVGDTSLRRGEAAVLHPNQREMMEAVGIDVEAFDGGPYDVRRALQIAKRAVGGPAADVYATLSDGQLTDDWAMNLFPNMHMSMHAEGTLWMRYFPHRSDPGKCFLHIVTLARPGVPFDFYLPEADEFERSGRPVRRRVRHDDPAVKDVIGQLLWEDIRNTRETQLGLQSRGFKSMRLSEHEQPMMYQYTEIQRYLDA